MTPFDVWFRALRREARAVHNVYIPAPAQPGYAANYAYGMTLVDAIYAGPLGEHYAARVPD